MQAMIFAAGLGTRLRPLTDKMPKALVEVDGKPLIEHVIEKLRKSGFTSIVVNVHHFSNQIIDYLNAHDFGVDIRISDETDKLLDTGGGLRKAAHLFNPDEQVLIHNVDILSNADLRTFYEQGPLMTNYATGGKMKAAATLLVSWRKTKRYLLFDADMRLVGWTNIETGEVKSPYRWLREFGRASRRSRLSSPTMTTSSWSISPRIRQSYSQSLCLFRNTLHNPGTYRSDGKLSRCIPDNGLLSK